MERTNVSISIQVFSRIAMRILDCLWISRIIQADILSLLSSTCEFLIEAETGKCQVKNIEMLTCSVQTIVRGSTIVWARTISGSLCCCFCTRARSHWPHSSSFSSTFTSGTRVLPGSATTYAWPPSPRSYAFPVSVNSKMCNVHKVSANWSSSF